MITGRIVYGIQLSHCNCNKIYVIYLFCINGLIRFKTILKLDIYLYFNECIFISDYNTMCSSNWKSRKYINRQFKLVHCFRKILKAYNTVCVF